MAQTSMALRPCDDGRPGSGPAVAAGTAPPMLARGRLAAGRAAGIRGMALLGFSVRSAPGGNLPDGRHRDPRARKEPSPRCRMSPQTTTRSGGCRPTSPDPADQEEPPARASWIHTTRPIGPMGLRSGSRRPYIIAGVAVAALLGGAGAALAATNSPSPRRPRARWSTTSVLVPCAARSGPAGRPQLPPPRTRARRRRQPVRRLARPVRRPQVRRRLPDHRRTERPGNGREQYVHHAQERRRIHEELHRRQLDPRRRATRRNRLGQGRQPGIGTGDGQRQHRHGDQHRGPNAAAAEPSGLRPRAVRGRAPQAG